MTNTAGIRKLTIQKLESFENQTFWRSVFKWLGFGSHLIFTIQNQSYKNVGILNGFRIRVSGSHCIDVLLSGYLKIWNRYLFWLKFCNSLKGTILKCRHANLSQHDLPLSCMFYLVSQKLVPPSCVTSSLEWMVPKPSFKILWGLEYRTLENQTHWNTECFKIWFSTVPKTRWPLFCFLYKHIFSIYANLVILAVTCVYYWSPGVSHGQ